jgi:hypothetical protein
MAAIPIKPEYGPTLGELLAPRWRRAGRGMRRAVIAAVLLLAVGLVALVLTLQNAHYSRGGVTPFRFSYRGLYRTAPGPGEYVRVEQRSADGRLLYSFAVAPLRLPAYKGELSGELPIYAAAYIRRQRRLVGGFVFRGEGKTKVNTVPAYDVLYTRRVGGEEIYERDILLLPERQGARDGVDILLMTAAGASRQIDGPIEVGTVGILVRPLRSFTLG